MESEKDLLMYYHTTIRNVGLFASISFAGLGYSRIHRNKDKIYNMAIIFVSLAFLAISLYITHFLINDFEKYQLKIKSENANKWLLLPKSILFFNIGVFLLGTYMLYREIRA